MSLTREQRAYCDSLSGLCQLCGERSTSLQLDHDHESEIARGFVCEDCNRFVIEAAKKKPLLVTEKALAYLSNPPLQKFNWIVKNYLRKPCFGNYHATSEFWYKEILDCGRRVASIQIPVDRSKQIEVTYYRPNGDIRITKRFDYWSHSETDLMSRVLRNRRP